MSVSRILPPVVLLVLLAVGIWFFIRRADSTVAVAKPVPHRTKAAISRPPPRPAAALTPAAAAKIPAEEWRTRFLTEYQDVDPELREQVVMLAGELEKSVAAGLDPASEEARAYGETIILLLAEKHVAP